LRIDADFSGILKGGGKDVEEEFRVRVSVDVAVDIFVEELFQIRSICKIAILLLGSTHERQYMTEHNSVR
jgi:hypothetical protein